MKLKRLIVSKYKNVERLNLKFKTPLISLLVGRNGLGKSNLIEILALIFRDLERAKTETDFKEWAYGENRFEYYINYDCQNSDLRILCRGGSFRIFRRQKETKTRHKEISISEFKERRIAEFLPTYIIGYYSGENKRIKEIIKPYEEDVIKDLKRNQGLDKGLRRFFFAQNHHAQMILLTLFLYKDQTIKEKFGKKVRKLIKDFCSFDGMEELSLELKQPNWYSRTKKNIPQNSIENIEENILNEVDFPFWGAKGKADKIITYFYNNTSDRIAYSDDENPVTVERVERLELKSINKTDAAAGVYETFKEPANFFDALESLLLIDALNKINLKVISTHKNISFLFSELSEGEQQLITILGLVLMVGNEDCLFLLDEPDTHLNPIWQRQYVKLLTDFNLDDRNSHMIVATHSPLIVQAAQKADIFLYTEKNGNIEVHENYMEIQNWRIDQVLVSEYFNLESSRPPRLDPFFAKRNIILSKRKLSKKDRQDLKNLEIKYGGLPSGETPIDIEVLKFLTSIKPKLSPNG